VHGSYRQPAAALALAVAMLGLAACSGEDTPQVTQVAAKVNGDEITVHLINQAVQRLGNVPEGQAQAAQKQILDRLVDQQLLVQQAVENKLDREPRVVQAIEAARRQILAQAYVERVTGTAVKATPEQVAEFYDKHPELFQERRIYRFAQLAIAAPADKHAAIRAKLEELDKQADKAKILSQLAEWLRAQGLQFRATQATQAAEQLPLEMLPRYHKMNLGDLSFSAAPQGVLVAQLTASQSQPLNKEQATPFIEQFLQNREKVKLSDEEMKRLRAAAKIEYVGEFANMQGEQPAATDTPAVPVPPEEAAQEGQADDEDAMSKGLKGLK
jgi:EpsD family peptidyl-prolyl cis-trans isomerase